MTVYLVKGQSAAESPAARARLALQRKVLPEGHGQRGQLSSRGAFVNLRIILV